MAVIFIVRINTVAPGTTADNGLNTAIIRGAYLIAAGGMLAYVGAYFYKRSRERFAILAPLALRKVDEVNSPSIPQLLAHSAIVLKAPRILRHLGGGGGAIR